MSNQSDFVCMWKETEEFAKELNLRIVIVCGFELEDKNGETVQAFDTVKELRAYLMGREDGMKFCQLMG